MAVERVLSNLNLISFKTEGGLQNHIDELQDGDLVFTPDSSLKGNLFDFKWTDHKLNDISWLNADTFSWQSGDVYVAAYEHLLDDFENRVGKGTDSDGWLSETIDGVTVYYVAAPDGHKICMQDNEANVQALYEKTGVAWYYILDTANKQFKLPRTKFGFTGLRDSVGGYVPAGLPNITGSVGIKNQAGVGLTDHSGAFYASFTNKYAPATGSSDTATGNAAFDASRSSSVYGNSNTVQPKATQMYLYFYVGNFERDAIEQTAGLNTELFNEKADVDLSNLTAAGKEVCANMAMPSDKYVDLTLGASNATYVAPANGYFVLAKTSSASWQVLTFILNNTQIDNFYSFDTSIQGVLCTPVAKGDSLKINYTFGGQTDIFRFIYANGSK
jgi:hypothetical protein